MSPESLMSMKGCRRVLLTGCALLMPWTTLAQGVERPGWGTSVIGEQPGEPLFQQALRLSMQAGNDWSRSRVGAVTPLMMARGGLRQSGNSQGARAREKRTVGRRILGALVGGVGGFFAGAYTGAWIEGDRCQCDAAGLKGAVIGGTTGAAAGGILGGLYLF